jgi:hypothetical protein
MVQGELSLDSVKVVRNDLSESDLEIIQTTATPASKSAQKLLAVEAPKLTSSALDWSAPVARLSGIDKT